MLADYAAVDELAAFKKGGKQEGKVRKLRKKVKDKDSKLELEALPSDANDRGARDPARTSKRELDVLADKARRDEGFARAKKKAEASSAAMRAAELGAAVGGAAKPLCY